MNKEQLNILQQVFQNKLLGKSMDNFFDLGGEDYTCLSIFDRENELEFFTKKGNKIMHYKCTKNPNYIGHDMNCNSKK